MMKKQRKIGERREDYLHYTHSAANVESLSPCHGEPSSLLHWWGDISSPNQRHRCCGMAEKKKNGEVETETLLVIEKMRTSIAASARSQASLHTHEESLSKEQRNRNAHSKRAIFHMHILTSDFTLWTQNIVFCKLFLNIHIQKL